MSSLEIILIAAVVALVATPFVLKFSRRQKARSIQKFAAVEIEVRGSAPSIADFASRNFEQLARPEGDLITYESLTAVLEKAAHRADREQIELLRSRLEPQRVDGHGLLNWPIRWLTPLGHVIEQQKEKRTGAIGAGMGGAVAYNYDVTVDIYGASRDDIATFVSRVNAQPLSEQAYSRNLPSRPRTRR